MKQAMKTAIAASQAVDFDGLAHTKIVATLGPATVGRVAELVQAGMSVARINLSHETPVEHARRIEEVREVSRELGLPIGILCDLPGPKLRLGRFPGGLHRVRMHDRVRLVERDEASRTDEIPLPLPGLLRIVRPGDRVFLNDGIVELRVDDVGNGELSALVVRGGPLGDGKGVHLPDSELELEVPTEADLDAIDRARELGADMIGVSFVSRGEEIARVRERYPNAFVIAKIERAAAIENLAGIFEVAHGIMVARGDLGVELELGRLPVVQKALLEEALGAGLFTITATEMLESMVRSTRPTRAEVTDVANAILDGTDAVMLSAETAVGENPVEAVRTMSRIAHFVETSQRYQDQRRFRFRASEPSFSNATALAAAQAAAALGLSKIVCFTETGNTVRLLSRYRPMPEIVALSPHESTLSHLTVMSHVRAFHFPRHENLEEMLEAASRFLLARGLVEEGEEIVYVAGVPPGVASSTNVMKLHRVGEGVRFLLRGPLAPES